MATYEAPRGSIRDLRFFLKEVTNGPLMDQYNFTDGLAHGQWPVVEFWTGPNQTGTNITSLVVKNITADTIGTATHKDPTGASGVWRSAQGTYWVRVQPQNALAIDDYYLHVSFMPTSVNTRAEDFDFEVLSPGDIDPNADITPDDIRIGFTSALTDEQISPIIEAATEDVYGWLEDGGIADPEAYIAANGFPRTWKRAIIERTQCLILGYDLSAGTRITEIAEGTERIKFAGATYGNDVCANAERRIKDWLRRHAPGRKAMFGLVTKRVGHTVNDLGDLNSDSDPGVLLE